MTSRHNDAIILHPALLSALLAASLTACGGGNSRHNGGGSDIQTLPLTEENRFQAIGSFLSIFPAQLNMLNVIAEDAIDASGWPFTACTPSSYRVTETPTSASVTYNHCSSSNTEEALESNSPWRAQSALSVHGTAALPNLHAGMPDAAFDTFQVHSSSTYEEWLLPVTGTPLPDADYRDEQALTFTVDGSFVYESTAPSITSDFLTVSYSQTGRRLEQGEVVDSLDQQLQYTLRDMLFTPASFQMSLTLHEGHGNLTTDIVMQQIMSYIADPGACLTMGELQWTDTEGNVMGVLFSGPQDVTITFNGNATTYPCAEYITAVAPYIIEVDF